MKYLLDANVFLEAIVSGKHAQEASALISGAPAGWLAMTDFSLHTVGLIVAHRAPAEFSAFLDDLIRRHIFTLHLTPSDLYSVVERMESMELDFDDAFQYRCAELNNLKIVSFDSDFDRTLRKRITPADALSEIDQAVPHHD